MKGERLYFLRRMNAWTPARADSAAAGRRRADAHPRRPRGRRRGRPHRYRLRYTKLGRVAFLGHLDLVRHLPRIFRRAGLELFYSIGFHPKPELSFGPALGLGIPSLGELVDVTLIDDLPPDELLRASFARDARRDRVPRRGPARGRRSRARARDRRGGVRGAVAARAPTSRRRSARFGGATSRSSAGRESDKGLARTVDVRRTLHALRALRRSRSCAGGSIGRTASWSPSGSA